MKNHSARFYKVSDINYAKDKPRTNVNNLFPEKPMPNGQLGTFAFSKFSELVSLYWIGKKKSFQAAKKIFTILLSFVSWICDSKKWEFNGSHCSKIRYLAGTSPPSILKVSYILVMLSHYVVAQFVQKAPLSTLYCLRSTVAYHIVPYLAELLPNLRGQRARSIWRSTSYL